MSIPENASQKLVDMSSRIEHLIGELNGAISKCDCCGRGSWHDEDEAKIRRRLEAVSTKILNISESIDNLVEKRSGV